MMKRHSLVVIFILFIFIGVLYAEDNSTQAQNYYFSGLVDYANGDYEIALEKFIQVLNISPSHEGAKKMVKEVGKLFSKQKQDRYFNQGMTRYEQGDFQGAHQNFIEVLKLDPGHKKANHYVNKIRGPERETTEDDRLKKIYKRAQRYYRQRQYIRATEEFEKLLKEPEESEMRIWAEKGMKKIQGKMEKMLTKKSSKGLRDIHYAQGYRYWREEKDDLAVVEWQKVLILEPENQEVLEYTGAKKEGLVAERVNNLFEDGMAFYKAGKLKSAVSEWEELLNLDPAHKEARHMIEKARAEEEKRILAARLAEEKERKRRELEKKKKEEEALARKNREESAKLDETKKKAIYVPPVQTDSKTPQTSASGSDDVSVLYSKGLQAYALGNLEEALGLWEEVLAIDPEHSRAQRNLERVRKEIEAKK